MQAGYAGLLKAIGNFDPAAGVSLAAYARPCISGELTGAEDPQPDRMPGLHAVAAHWGELAPREQQILIMVFHDDMTQAEIGLRLPISQMHVSRPRALGHLRARLTAA